MPNAPIAGPRRVRPTTPPTVAAQTAIPAGAVRAPHAPTTSHAPPPGVPLGPGSTRALPPLDYDDTGVGRRPQALEATQPGRRRAEGRGRSNRVLWFALGIAFGAVAAVFARGDALGTLHAARAWGASTLRSLEHKPAAAAPTSPATPSSLATETATGASAAFATAAKNAPCPVDPGPGDPCAELLAPFATNIPTVNVDDLPAAPEQAVLPVAAVVVVARRHPRAHTPAPAATHAPAATEESAETSPATPGINPDDDDAETKPAKVVPTATPVEHPAAPDPPADLKSARNDAT
ncbi:MAG: hypothetical protein ABSE49_27695 [Polyangiaceae bacterium]